MSRSQNDPAPVGRGGPPARLVALIAVVVMIVVILHLTGVIGQG